MATTRTFDVFDLAEQMCDDLIAEVMGLYRHERESGFNSNDYLKIFRYAKEHRDIFLVALKLGAGERAIEIWDREQAVLHFNGEHVSYHMAFFRAGFTAILKMWLEGGCREMPEEMFDIIHAEYRGRLDWAERRKLSGSGASHSQAAASAEHEHDREMNARCAF